MLCTCRIGVKLLVSHRIVWLMVRINWSAFAPLFSAVLSFELLKTSHRFHGWLLVVVIPSRRTIDFPSRFFPTQYKCHHAIRKCSITSRTSLHIEMVTSNCLHSAGGSCRVPCVLVCLHDAVGQSIFWIIDPLQPTVSVGGFVGIASDCVALVSRNKWLHSILQILSFCSMSDIRMDMENSTVEGWRVIFGIYTTDLGAEETSEHSECSSPVWGSCRDVSCQEFLIAMDKTCDASCRPGFDHDALVSWEEKQTDEFLAFFVLEIEKCVRFVEAREGWRLLLDELRDHVSSLGCHYVKWMLTGAPTFRPVSAQH